MTIRGGQNSFGRFWGRSLGENAEPLDVEFTVSFQNEISAFTGKRSSMANHRSTRMFYGWWIVVAAFLNLFFAVGIIFYGFPVFYPAFVESLGFTRAQVTQGFLLGFLVAGLPVGFLAGAGVDRVGARLVLLLGGRPGGISLFLLGAMAQLGHYGLTFVMGVFWYVLAGPPS